MVLVPGATAPKADIDAPIADDIDHGNVFGQANRVVERRHEDGGPQPNSPGVRCQCPQQHQRRGAEAIPREMVLRQPGALEPQGFAVLDLLGDLFDEAPRNSIFRPGQVGEKAKLHCRLLRVQATVIAVGIPVARYPLHRSGREVLPHPTPTFGAWRQSVRRTTDEGCEAWEASGLRSARGASRACDVTDSDAGTSAARSL